jgi:hypothetical protein
MMMGEVCGLWACSGSAETRFLMLIARRNETKGVQCRAESVQIRL